LVGGPNSILSSLEEDEQRQRCSNISWNIDDSSYIFNKDSATKNVDSDDAYSDQILVNTRTSTDNYHRSSVSADSFSTNPPPETTTNAHLKADHVGLKNRAPPDNTDEYDCDIDWNAINLDFPTRSNTAIHYDIASQTTGSIGIDPSHPIYDRVSSIAMAQQATLGQEPATDVIQKGPLVIGCKSFKIERQSLPNLEQKQELLHHSLAPAALLPTFQNELPPNMIYDKVRVRPVDDEFRKELIKNADLSGTLNNGWNILPHQKAGILRGILMRRLILAFDMGLGKTLIGCVWAKAFKRTFPKLKVFIVCPVSLAKEWSRTVTEVTGLECEEESKTGKSNVSKNAATPLSCKICSWAKVPYAPKDVERYVVIADEAHSMQNMESTRTRDMLSLVSSERYGHIQLMEFPICPYVSNKHLLTR